MSQIVMAYPLFALILANFACIFTCPQMPPAKKGINRRQLFWKFTHYTRRTAAVAEAVVIKIHAT